MSKKKLATLLVAGALTVSVVGGTLAWFTSSDNATNVFSTPGATDGTTTENSGVKIHENFDKDKALKVTPGTEVNKEVQVHSDVNYDQFVRVRITPEFTNAKDKNLDTNMIKLTFSDKLSDKKEAGTWYKDADGYYYYIGKLGARSFTNTLLKSVTLNPAAGNEYKGVGFNVKVDTDSVQATNDAYTSWAVEDLHQTFKTLQAGNVTTPTDTIITTIPEK